MTYPRPSVLRWILALCLFSAAQSGQAEHPDPKQIWRTDGGRMTLEIRGDFLPDFGIEVLHQGEPVNSRKKLHFNFEQLEAIRIHAPWGIFDSLFQDIGRLTANADLVFRRGGRELRLERIQIIPGERDGHSLFLAMDDQGNHLFTMSHLHVELAPETSGFSAANAEVEASAYLAERLGLPQMTDMPIALGWLDLDLSIPEGAELAGTPPGCAERPIWPQDGQFEADVTLIGMGNVAYQGVQPRTGRIKTAPSATLKNESQADIPWIGHFTQLASYPYTPEDQHPYLVWNIYKIAEGRIEMLAASGAKHAFFTVNQGCDINCNDNHVLWPGCEDTYSSGNNDTSTYQGPRDEIEASIGRWENCGSFFDPECTGSQSGFSGQWLNRLLIDPDEFQQPDTQYFMDAWYVIQYDTNIWNGMGFRPIDPTPSGSGWFMNPGTFSQGPVISQWVEENTTDPMADHDVIVIPSETPAADYPDNMPQGHLRLLVKVTETQPGRYRYNYALQNYDFDRALDGFKIAVPPGAEITDIHFGDIDDNPTNDWVTTIGNGFVAFRATEGNRLGWFTLFNFEIEIDAAPVDSQIRIDLGNDAVEPELSVQSLGPASGSELLFEDRFIDVY